MLAALSCACRGVSVWLVACRPRFFSVPSSPPLAAGLERYQIQVPAPGVCGTGVYPGSRRTQGAQAGTGTFVDGSCEKYRPTTTGGSRCSRRPSTLAETAGSCPRATEQQATPRLKARQRAMDQIEACCQPCFSLPDPRSFYISFNARRKKAAAAHPQLSFRNPLAWAADPKGKMGKKKKEFCSQQKCQMRLGGRQLRTLAIFARRTPKLPWVEL